MVGEVYPLLQADSQGKLTGRCPFTSACPRGGHSDELSPLLGQEMLHDSFGRRAPAGIARADEKNARGIFLVKRYQPDNSQSIGEDFRTKK